LPFWGLNGWAVGMGWDGSFIHGQCNTNANGAKTKKNLLHNNKKEGLKR
jgi:hypothetical protein